MYQKLLDDLPAIYEKFFPEFFHTTIRKETLATCDQCAMCVQPGQPKLPGVEYFQPDAKCCTFHPKLPNYLIGALLLDSDPAMEEGRRRIRARIRERVGVNPQGLMPSKKYAVLHKYAGERSFGKNRSLLCPFFVKEAGNCSIWRFREGVCSTYFCKSVAGSDGKRFWNVLRGYLMHIQDSLIWYILQESNWNVEKIYDYLSTYNNDHLEAGDLDDIQPTDEAYRELWGEWEGREEEFFKKCFDIVSGLTREQFVSITGVTQNVFLTWLQKRHEAIVSPVVPATLKMNPEMKAHRLDDGNYVVITAAGFFTIQAALHEVVQLFNGVRKTADIKKIVEQQYADTLNDELLISLYQNRLVVSAGSEK